MNRSLVRPAIRGPVGLDAAGMGSLLGGTVLNNNNNREMGPMGGVDFGAGVAKNGVFWPSFYSRKIDFLFCLLKLRFSGRRVKKTRFLLSLFLTFLRF